MAMHSGSTVAPAGEPGRYRAKIKSDMSGDRTRNFTTKARMDKAR